MPTKKTDQELIAEVMRDLKKDGLDVTSDEGPAAGAEFEDGVEGDVDGFDERTIANAPDAPPPKATPAATNNDDNDESDEPTRVG